MPYTPAWLAAVQPWFDHPEVRRRLGGRDWPPRELRLLATQPGGEYRGRRVLAAHSWVALDEAGRPVGKVGGEVYDRWTRYGGEGGAGPLILASDPRRAMGLAYVVAPDRWGRGYGRAILLALPRRPEVAAVRLFVAGIEPDNLASIRCCEAAGFVTERAGPDWEGMVYYSKERAKADTSAALSCSAAGGIDNGDRQAASARRLPGDTGGAVSRGRGAR